MSDYTPITEEVKNGWISNCWEFCHRDSLDEMDYSEQFDRWLAAHDAEVYERGREDADREADQRNYVIDQGSPYAEAYQRGRWDAANAVTDCRTDLRGYLDKSVAIAAASWDGEQK